MKNTLILLYGGRSGEHEVSCRSAAAIAKNLNKEKYNLLLVGVTQQGQWFLQPHLEETITGEMTTLPIHTKEGNEVWIVPGKGLFIAQGKLAGDILFPITHGTFGEDGRLQGMLESCGMAYVGAGVLGSAVGMDKDVVKVLWNYAGLPTVPHLALGINYSNQDLDEAIKQWGFPLFVKPACAGSSVGVGRADNHDELKAALKEAFLYDFKVMVEPCVDAREVECSVLGNHDPQVFTPGEIVPQNHVFYDYEAKYLDPDGAALLIPAPLTQEQTKQVQELAKKAYLHAQCRGFARVDFFLDKKTNQFMLNEINTLPGFTEVSMYSMLCKASGLEYSDLLDRLIELGLESHQQREALKFSR